MTGCSVGIFHWRGFLFVHCGTDVVVRARFGATVKRLSSPVGIVALWPCQGGNHCISSILVHVLLCCVWWLLVGYDCDCLKHGVGFAYVSVSFIVLSYLDRVRLTVVWHFADWRYHGYPNAHLFSGYLFVFYFICFVWRFLGIYYFLILVEIQRIFGYAFNGYRHAVDNANSNSVKSNWGECTWRYYKK